MVIILFFYHQKSENTAEQQFLLHVVMRWKQISAFYKPVPVIKVMAATEDYNVTSG